MSALVALVGSALVVLALALALRAGSRAYRLYSGIRVLACPSSGETAALEVDAWYAALTAALGRPRLRLRFCSRRPEGEVCGSACLLRIDEVPEEGLPRTILTRWYRGRSCAFCGNTFEEIRWSEFSPALLARDGRTIECSEVPVEILPEVLVTHRPVCWSCHVVETFRKAHPGVFVDRPQPAAPPPVDRREDPVSR